MNKKLKFLIFSTIAFTFVVESFDKFKYENTPLQINHYGPPYLNPFFSISKNTEKLFNAIPKVLLDNLLKELNLKTSKDLLNNFNSNDEKQKINLDFYITFWKTPFNKEKNKYEWPDQRFNLIFHELAGKWANKTQPFNEPIAMGIFDANGVEEVKSAIGVPFDKFGVLFQNKHDNAYSPNNAHFNLKNNQNIASFWTSAFSPNKKNLFVSFNILFNAMDKEIEEVTQTIFNASQAKSISNVINAMEKSSEILNKKIDKAALDYAIKIFKQIVKLSSKPRINPINKSLTIFGKGGYLELISTYKKLLSSIRDDLSKSINSTNKIDQAVNILFEIASASNDIESLTPLRAFLAANDFYPEQQNKIYLDVKNKKEALKLFQDRLQEKFTQLENMKTTSNKIPSQPSVVITSGKKTLKDIQDLVNNIFVLSKNEKNTKTPGLDSIKTDIKALRDKTKHLEEKSTDQKQIDEIYNFAKIIENILKSSDPKEQASALAKYNEFKKKPFLT